MIKKNFWFILPFIFCPVTLYLMGRFLNQTCTDYTDIDGVSITFSLLESLLCYFSCGAGVGLILATICSLSFSLGVCQRFDISFGLYGLTIVIAGIAIGFMAAIGLKLLIKFSITAFNELVKYFKEGQ
jgi:hypothetical protein